MDLHTAAVAGRFALFTDGLKQARREIVQFAESLGNNFRKLLREKLRSVVYDELRHEPWPVRIQNEHTIRNSGLVGHRGAA